jgi:hypothetical protein
MGCWFNKCFQIQRSLLKIQISVKFWLRNDLSLVNNKNTLEQHKDDDKCGITNKNENVDKE